MLGLGKHENLAHKRVQIHRDARLAFGLEHGANALDYLAGLMSISDDRLKDRPCFAEIGSRSCKPAQARIGTCSDSG